MNFNRIGIAGCVAALFLLFGGCSVKYSLSGASISPLAKTFSVTYFPNNATMVAPILSATLTDALQERFIRQARLRQVNENGDLHMEGEITNYTSTPSSITSDASGVQGAAQNRLTVTVRVRFTNAIDPQWNFNNRTFSAYLDYPSTQLLQSAEPTLIPQLVEILVEDIFNAAVSNW